ncbi:MAG TPA: TIGR01777 family oxidoreductase [Ferruginibacter sp.]|nr:TIGR01777 family oxidoreductase [Ferruginibacter sp.]
MQTVLITGGTGLIGKELTKKLLEKGYKVIILTRKLPQNSAVLESNVSYAIWDIKKQTIDVAAMQKADHIIHLAGAGVVDKKWTAAYKKEIQDSRTKSSELLITTLKNNANKIKTIVSASAIGWYGPDAVPVKAFIETDKADTSFLGETCRLWEERITPVEQLGKRLVILRTGIVLSGEGGALAEFKKPLQYGVASILGNGKQVVSWLHIDDLCRLYIEAIENEQVRGIYNAVSPTPVTNATLTLTLAREMRGKFYIAAHVPKFVLQIMLGERSIEVLKSATVSSKKIQQAGFSFLYPTIESALRELVKK